MFITGEPLDDDDVETLMKECCDPEDEDGCIPYEGKCMHFVLVILYIAYK